MKQDKRNNASTIKPDAFDKFKLPANSEELFEHLAWLDELASTLHSKKSFATESPDKTDVSSRLGIDKAPPKRGHDRQEPWMGNSSLSYVVDLMERDETGRLAVLLVTEDFDALHAKRSSSLKKDSWVSTRDPENPGTNLHLEWARRFAWSVVLSVEVLRREQRTQLHFPLPETWAALHNALLLGTALRNRHISVRAWKLAIARTAKRRREANKESGRAIWKSRAPYHQKVRELAFEHLRTNPQATPNGIAHGIIADLEFWLENWTKDQGKEGTTSNDAAPQSRQSSVPQPTESTLARYIRSKWSEWELELKSQADS